MSLTVRATRRVRNFFTLIRLLSKFYRPESRLLMSALFRARLVLDRKRAPFTDIEELRDQAQADTAPFEEIMQGVPISATLGEHAKVASSPDRTCRFIYNLVTDSGAKICLEMGTSIGISGAYIARALKGRGQLVTLEGNPQTADIARRHFADLELKNARVVEGMFLDTLPSVLVDLAPIDVLFLDGHKQGDAMEQYFKLALPHIAPGALVIFDDVRWNESMAEAWQRILVAECATFQVELFGMGFLFIKGEK